MIEFYLKYKQNYNSNYNIMKKCKNPQSIKESRNWRSIEIGRKTYLPIVNELDPNECTKFILLSNIYAIHSSFEEAIEQRLFLKEEQMDKGLRCSLIEVNGEVHKFIARKRRECAGEDKMQGWT